MESQANDNRKRRSNGSNKGYISFGLLKNGIVCVYYRRRGNFQTTTVILKRKI